MSRRLFTEHDCDEVLGLIAQGHTIRGVAAETGWSVGRVQKTIDANRGPQLGARLTVKQRAKLGPDVVRWAEEHEDAALETQARMRRSGGWIRPPMDTAILLALAEQVHADLVAQTGGRHPTMRAALYRMMGVYGAAKELYEALGRATTTARKHGALERDFWAEADPLTNAHPQWWTPQEALRWSLEPLDRPPLTLRGTGLVVGVVVEAAGLEGAIEQRLGYELPAAPRPRDR